MPQLVGSDPLVEGSLVDYHPCDRVGLESVLLSCCVWCQGCSTTSSWQQMVPKQHRLHPPLFVFAPAAEGTSMQGHLQTHGRDHSHRII